MSKVLPAMIYGAIALRSGSIIKEIVVDDDVLSVRCSIPVPPPSGFAPRVFGLMQPHADALSRKTGQHEKGKNENMRFELINQRHTILEWQREIRLKQRNARERSSQIYRRDCRF